MSRNARVAGLLYIVASIVGVVRLLYVPGVLFVPGDAVATAANISAHESLFRLGMICNLVAGAIWLFVPIALYRVLKDVDHGVAILMVILGSIMQSPIYIVATATDAIALQFVRGDQFLSTMDKTQRAVFARIFLNLHHQIDLCDMLFAGLWLLPFGYLVFRSRFVPRILGIWLIAGSVPYMAMAISGLIVPGSESRVMSMGQPLMLSEVGIMLWLTIFGARARGDRIGAAAAVPAG